MPVKHQRASKSLTNGKMLNRTKTSVRIRMYRQGLGDCFLITFRRPKTTNFNVVIDCGVLHGSPKGSDRIKAAVTNIAAETNGRIDLLIATHEHADHLSGFNKVRDIWEKFKIERIWLAWTENEVNPAVQQLKNRQRMRLRAALAGMRRIQAVAAGMSGEHETKLQGSASFIRGLLAFSLEEEDEVDSILSVAASGGKLTGPARAMAWLKERNGSALEYCHPKDPPRQLAGVDGVRVFVLGPPEGPLLRHSDPSPGEGYGVFGGLANVDACFGLALSDNHPTRFCECIDPLLAQPFDASFQRPFETVKAQASKDADSFFALHYGFDNAAPSAWRWIDTDWLNLSEGLALALTGHINNTSLALAFELEENGPVLLFPGDAQAGSWTSWSGLKWEISARDGDRRFVTGTDLLRRTAFYKVGHHGSHNATMKENGLEVMERRDLVAFIPVHQKTAHAQVPEWKMPWQPLWDRLNEKAGHRVILSDQDEDMEHQLRPPASRKDDNGFQHRWKAFRDAVDWDQSSERLWVDYKIG